MDITVGDCGLEWNYSDGVIHKADYDDLIEAFEKTSVQKKAVLCMNEKEGMFVDYEDGTGEYKEQTKNYWRCPCCNSVVGERYSFRGRIHDQRKKNYCENCGCSIGWN